MNSVGLEVSIEDVSERTGALALQRAIVPRHSPTAGHRRISPLSHFRSCTPPSAIWVTISRTGYTGDLGFEPGRRRPRHGPLDALIEAGTPYGITPAGIWALDLACIEAAGLVMPDVDRFSAHRAVIEDQKSSPFELNLVTVSADKGPHNAVGRAEKARTRGDSWAWTSTGNR
jgi:aminomethyltransferase